MVQVHVPQGVGVRVPPWAPQHSKARRFVDGLFASTDNITSVSWATPNSNQLPSITAKINKSTSATANTKKNGSLFASVFINAPYADSPFSTTHSIDEDECYRTPRMVDGSKDLSPDNQDGNPVRPMNMPCTR